MSLYRQLGKKHMEIAKLWTGSMGVFGGTVGALFLYISDWKAVMGYVPFYASKFNHEIPR